MQPTQESSPTSHKSSTTGSRLLQITREFKVPVETLFKAFTTAEAIKAWWWPKGLYADKVEYDFQEGGDYFINMKGYDQGGGGMAGHFENIIENKRIVMSDQFADEDGNVISAKEAKMPGTWPEWIFITLDFESLGDNSSRLNLSQEGIPNELQEECLQGWNESFDKLETYFEEIKH
jgi:uncharacterized protein YndB with AHSA1/START domain